MKKNVTDCDGRSGACILVKNDSAFFRAIFAEYLLRRFGRLIEGDGEEFGNTIRAHGHTIDNTRSTHSLEVVGIRIS